MANLNKVMLIGRLTRDPELRFTPGGTAAAEFGLAVNRTWTDQSGEKKENTCFVDIQAWGRQAETINQYMKKGRQIFIEGRLDYSSWDGQDGKKHSRIRVVVESFQFLDGGKREDGPGGEPAGEESGGGEPAARSSRPQRPPAVRPPSAPPSGAGPAPPMGGNDYNLDDPPF
ncbi:MAG: single-stranded DNA-binding protein [Planctomycetes bacterium]|nr:single-stranded DNA-binding protein [Planctomycetota bacterium]MBI3845119.1 single-stranded DNA-binding protein [Planctomycetota bacterium]